MQNICNNVLANHELFFILNFFPYFFVHYFLYTPLVLLFLPPCIFYFQYSLQLTNEMLGFVPLLLSTTVCCEDCKTSKQFLLNAQNQLATNNNMHVNNSLLFVFAFVAMFTSRQFQIK